MKLPRVDGKKLVKGLQKLGFEVVRVGGSHFHLYSSEKDVLVTAPCHASRTLSPKTLKAILKSAKINVKELLKVL